MLYAFALSMCGVMTRMKLCVVTRSRGHIRPKLKRAQNPVTECTVLIVCGSKLLSKTPWDAHGMSESMCENSLHASNLSGVRAPQTQTGIRNNILCNSEILAMTI